MSKFKETLRVIEEGLLKPMSDAEVKQIQDEKVNDIIASYRDRLTENADGSFDVDGNIILSRLDLMKLPLKFNKVSGDFWCDNNKLTTLEGSPKEGGGSFIATNNELTDLKDGPEKVADSFQCALNRLTSLEGAPKEVGKDFYCFDNAVKFTRSDVQKVCNVHGLIYTKYSDL